MSNKLGNAVAAVLAGGIVGVGLGLLFAPNDGKETRKKLKKCFDESKDDLSVKLDDLKKQVSSVVSSKKQDFDAGFNDLVENTGKKTSDIISALEAKLAALKEETDKEANK